MNEAIGRMLDRYQCSSLQDYLLALREILQEIALLGLWRSKFFEKAAFYGGTSLRILYGLDRFSEDLDFSLLSPAIHFDLSSYTGALLKELSAFGFDVRVEQRKKIVESAVQSAFLKANTISQLLEIQTDKTLVRKLHREQVLKIKLEVDTDPPPGFDTEVRYVLQPIPFAVRTYTLPDLFAGKMHAVLCRRWRNRSKGRDWYDLVWYAANYPKLNLPHLEQRMRQSGHWSKPIPLFAGHFKDLINEAIENLDVKQIRKEVELFVKEPDQLQIWSRKFFREVVERIQVE
jgi:predicted nucleotidyltransferase component of viral defense system